MLILKLITSKTMKKILAQLKIKWPEYLLEILVIIIGIIGAFMLNSWHEGRQERNFEVKMLNELHNSIQQNIDYLDLAIQRSDEAKVSCNLILEYFDNGNAYHDSLDLHFSRSLFWFHPSINNNAYESLKSYGLHIISNDSIRENLGQIYEWKFIERLSIRQEEYFYGTVSPLLSDWFESYEYIGEMKPQNFDALKSSAKYRHILKTMIYNREMQIGYFEKIRGDRLHLAEMIENDLM